MNIISLLKEHMQSLTDELNQLVHGTGIDHQELLNFCEELNIHLKMEDQCLLPALKQLEAAPEDVRDIQHCHRELQQAIKHLQTAHRQQIPGELRKLQEKLNDHFKQIQADIIPELENLPQDQREHLARKVEQFKQKEVQKQIH